MRAGPRRQSFGVDLRSPQHHASRRKRFQAIGGRVDPGERSIATQSFQEGTHERVTTPAQGRSLVRGDPFRLRFSLQWNTRPPRPMVAWSYSRREQRCPAAGLRPPGGRQAVLLQRLRRGELSAPGCGRWDPKRNATASNPGSAGCLDRSWLVVTGMRSRALRAGEDFRVAYDAKHTANHDPAVHGRHGFRARLPDRASPRGWRPYTIPEDTLSHLP
jgi:hypothetical protein